MNDKKKKFGAVRDESEVRDAPKSIDPFLLDTPAPPAPMETVVKAQVYKVAPGKAITTLKGMLTEGTQIEPSYLGGGEKAFDRLLGLEAIVKG